MSISLQGVPANSGATQTQPVTEKKDSAEQSSTLQKPNCDSYVPTQREERLEGYGLDMDKIRELKTNLNNQTGVLQSMVQGLVGKQLDFSGNVHQQLKDLLDQSGVTLDPSKEEPFFDHPEFGVEAVAGNIVSFAQALSGGDPSKIQMLKDAAIKGFQAAEKAWGSPMPTITGKTYDRVMELFDEWEKSTKEETNSEEAVSETDVDGAGTPED